MILIGHFRQYFYQFFLLKYCSFISSYMTEILFQKYKQFVCEPADVKNYIMDFLYQLHMRPTEYDLSHYFTGPFGCTHSSLTKHNMTELLFHKYKEFEFEPADIKNYIMDFLYQLHMRPFYRCPHCGSDVKKSSMFDECTHCRAKMCSYHCNTIIVNKTVCQKCTDIPLHIPLHMFATNYNMIRIMDGSAVLRYSN